MCNNRVGAVSEVKRILLHPSTRLQCLFGNLKDYSYICIVNIKLNHKGQIVNNMKEGVHHLGIGQRLWLNKVISKHQDWLDTIGYGDEGIIRIHQILRNDMYVEYDKRFLNTLREMYLEFFVYGVKH